MNPNNTNNKLVTIVGATILGLAALAGTFWLGRNRGIEEGRAEVIRAISDYQTLNLIKDQKFPEETVKSAQDGSRILGEARDNAYKVAFPELYSTRRD